VGVSPSHTYATAGSYTVSLTVTDDAGATATATATATIEAVPNELPTADAGGPYSGTEGVAVSFDGSGSSDPEGTDLTYNWDFGDGSTGSGVSVLHNYNEAGSYIVTLTVIDEGGASDSETTSASIQLSEEDSKEEDSEEDDEEPEYDELDGDRKRDRD
jgi:chitinase